MSIRFMISFMLLLPLILLQASSSGSCCRIEPRPDEGKYWILGTDLEKLDAETMDVFAYELARKNGFRLLWRYKGWPCMYVLEFRQSVLDAIRAENSGSENKICRLQKKAILDGMNRIRETPGILEFGRFEVKMKTDSCNGKSDELVINPPVGSDRESDEELLRHMEVRFFETSHERELYYANSVKFSTQSNPGSEPEDSFDEASTEDFVENNDCTTLPCHLEVTLNSYKSQNEFSY